jgi:hypothetical protein
MLIKTTNMAKMTNYSHLPRIAPLGERSALHGDCIRNAIHQLLAATSNPSFQENIHQLLSSHNLLVLPTPLPQLIFEGKDIFGPVTFECLENTEVKEDGSVNITHGWKLKAVGGGIRVCDTIKFHEASGQLGPVSRRKVEIFTPRTSSGSTLGMTCIVWVRSDSLAMASVVSESPRKVVWFYLQAPPVQEDFETEDSELDGSCDSTHAKFGLGSDSLTCW